MTEGQPPFDQIAGAIGADHVRAGAPSDAIDGAIPKLVIEPGNAQELAQSLAIVNEAGIAVIPRGGGTKIDWGNPPRSMDVLLSTRRLNRVIEHAAGDMTATVQAGCTVASFQETLARNGQRMAVDVHWPARATIGGMLAGNDSGMLRHAFGPLRDSLIGITVALADGTLARSGGKVVKNVAGYDLPKLFIGSFGTLGVIVEATFRLYPLPHASRTICYEATDISMLGRALENLRGVAQLATGIQFEASDDAPPKLRVRVEALAGALDEKCGQIQGKLGTCGRIVEDVLEPLQWRESLFGDPDGCVCKISVLPGDWAALAARMTELCASLKVRWMIVGQAMGVGLLCLNGQDAATACNVISDLRRECAARGGHLVILRAPPTVKGSVDIWGNVGDALPVMQAIKRQFDPKLILSPGRFVGGF
jgi:glycolate oxidase FAD binding subunit